MARTLPWLKSASQSTIGQTASRKRSNAAAKVETGQTRFTSIAQSTEVKEQDPPYSPPVREQLTPPAVEYMQEGFDADDKYRMVEDELYSTALVYTRHLHEDAYKEHNKRALARGQDAISNIERATNGRAPSKIAVAEKRAGKRARGMKKVKEQLVSDDSATATEDESSTRTKAASDPFAGFKALESQPLINLDAAVGKRSNTLAAAGYSKALPSPVRAPNPPISTYRARNDDSDTMTPSREHVSPSPAGMSRTPKAEVAEESLMTAHNRSGTSSFLAKRKAALEEKQRLLKRSI